MSAPTKLTKHKTSHSLNSETSYDMETEFVSWPMVRYKREVLFGWVDLLGTKKKNNCGENSVKFCFAVSFGGIAGLFLGFSLLSGVEVLYYFTMRACCMVYKETNELRRMNKEERTKPLPDYDLSMLPYFVKMPEEGNGTKEVMRRLYPEKNRVKQKKTYLLSPNN